MCVRIGDKIKIGDNGGIVDVRVKKLNLRVMRGGKMKVDGGCVVMCCGSKSSIARGGA